MKSRAKYLFSALVLIWSFLPIIWLLDLSLRSFSENYDNPAHLLPIQPTLAGYELALGIIRVPENWGGGLGLTPVFLAGFSNSLIISTLVMLVTLLLALPAGYAFGRFSFPFRTSIFFLIIVARMLPGESLLVTFVLMYKALNIGGTIFGLVMAHLDLTVPFAAWIIAGVFAAVPKDLDRQARVDGCSRLRTFVSVLIPAVLPSLMVVAMVSWLTSWNEWILALYLGDAYGLRTVSEVATAGGPAFLIITLIPAVVVTIFMQKYMTKLQLGSPPSLAAGPDALA